MAEVAELDPLTRAMLDATPEGQCVLDRAGRLRGANPKLLELVGCRGEGELVGLHALTVFPLLQQLGQEVVESVLAGQAVRGALEHLRPEQARQYFEVSLSPLTGKAGVLGALLTLRELAEPGAQLQRLAELHQLGLSARVARGAAHDLSNMLTVIHAEASRALMLSLDGEVGDSLQEIRICAEQSGRIVRNVLAFAATEGLPCSSFALRDLVGRLREPFEGCLGARRELVLEVPAEFAGRVVGPRSELEQVLLSLVLNAAEATPPGGTVRVLVDAVQVGAGKDELSLERRLPPGSYCRVRVLDTGAGMDARTQAQLFQPFVSSKGSAGLGLYTSRGLVERLGGALYVESKLGRGTTASVLLPSNERTLVPTVRPARPCLALAKTRSPDSDRPPSAPPRTGSEG